MENKIVYELKKIRIELKNDKNIYKGITVDNIEDNDPEIIDVFKSKEEALKALSNKKSQKWIGASNLIIFEEFFIEENIYNEDDEWINGRDIIDISNFQE